MRLFFKTDTYNLIFLKEARNLWPGKATLSSVLTQQWQLLRVEGPFSFLCTLEVCTFCELLLTSGGKCYSQIAIPSFQLVVLPFNFIFHGLS